MNDLLIVIVAGVEIIFSGSEMVLTFLNDTLFIGATLYAWLLGYITLDTIISLFVAGINKRKDQQNELA